ncbi:MAG TPA: tetratricopeptide repeat-containing protein [Stellaceae bacterium]|nr:tetratricopeptide repeat-containing protein [Stellaceae bacterium]
MQTLGGRAPRSRTAGDWLLLAQRSEREGGLFQAYDIAMQGLAKHPHDLRLKHRAVLCLASTHATAQAIRLFERLGLDLGQAEIAQLPPAVRMDIACLKARLRKDAALEAPGAAGRGDLREAAELYERCFHREVAASNPDSYYPGVNAATLWLLAGDREAATRLARDVLARLDTIGAAPSYYELVSAAEAHLILGEVDAARALMLRARAQVTGSAEADYRGLASTISQLRLVVEANGIDGSVLATLAPPLVVHYCGHIIAAPGQSGRFPAAAEQRVRDEIERRLAAMDIGFAYGSLAAGADIIVAEAVLARGASLHVVLPFDRREFVAQSVRPSGAGWTGRFERCLAAATSVRYATRDRYLGDDQLFAYCSQLAMGLALLRARFLATAAEQLAVWDGEAPAGPAGTAVDVANWRLGGHPSTRIDPGSTLPRPAAPRPAAASAGRRTRAMLFGDIRGFSKLTDSQLPPFVASVLGASAAIVARYRADILLANTWGDGLFLVFDDAGQAANCALDLQDAIAGVDLAAAGLPADLALRLGGHLGPVYTARDPIIERDNFFGAHVSRAARIEPVTPERCIYVTETLAAVLALHNADAFVCDYVGMTAAAKHFGKMRMFLLRRRWPATRSCAVASRPDIGDAVATVTRQPASNPPEVTP